MARRRCSEAGWPGCAGFLPAGSRSDRKTCSDACRDRRSRRLKAANKKRGVLKESEHLVPLQRDHNAELKKVMHEVAKEEIRPVVREAITDDVLAAVQKLVSLTPRMVDCIEEDLSSQDDTVRQRAYTLLARYTLGNPSVAPAAAEVQPAPMQVVFNMPRPGDSTPNVEATPADAEELKACVECAQEKPLQDFVGGSDRCQTCHDELQAKVEERFGARA